MELDTTSQKIQPIQNPPQDLPIQTTEHRQKGYIPVIIGIIILILVLTSVAYFIGLKTNKPTSQGSLDSSTIPQTQKQTSVNNSDFSDDILSTKGNKIYLTSIVTKETQPFNLEGTIDIAGYQYSYNNVFSPDKKWLLYIKDHNIWKVGRDLLNPKQLTTQGQNKTSEFWGVEAGAPKWSPDGKYIYYTVSIAVPGTDAVFPGMKSPTGIKEGVWLMDVDGNNQKQLSQVKSPINWMPNSKEIIFTDGISDTSNTKAFDVATGSIRNLISGKSIRDISWSLNGNTAVYSAGGSGDSYLINNGFETIASLQRQRGTIPADLLNTDYTLEFWESHLMSPDGRYALITVLTRPYTRGNASTSSYGYDHKVEVYLWDTQSKEQTKLPIYFSLHTKPFWSTDGKELIYVRQSPLPGSTSVSGERGDIFVYDLNTKLEARVTNSQDFDPFNIEY